MQYEVQAKHQRNIHRIMLEENKSPTYIKKKKRKNESVDESLAVLDIFYEIT